MTTNITTINYPTRLKLQVCSNCGNDSFELGEYKNEFIAICRECHTSIAVKGCGCLGKATEEV